MTYPEPNETTSDAQAATTQECASPRIPDASTDPFFWSAVYFGTIVAGGVFGGALFLFYSGLGEMFAGLLFGVLFTGVVATPIHYSVAIMTWMLWMSRFRVISAGLAGGTTGVFATHPIFRGSAPWLVFGAGVIGAIGALVAGVWANRKCRKLPKIASSNPIWQFTLRDLFLRMTVFAMLVAAWTWAIRSVYDIL